MRIIDPGLMTSIQDAGRFGWQKIGVSTSGAMDPVALRVANALVGNDLREAALEITLRGPVIEFQNDSSISICGADLSPEIADVKLPNWTAILVKRGSVLKFGEPTWGCRAYLAVAGGLAVPEVMNSRSTYPRAALGGMDGRPLISGDIVPVGNKRGSDGTVRSSPLPFALTDRSFPAEKVRDLYRPGKPLRTLAGPHFDKFDTSDRTDFFGGDFEVSSASDRMGYRLSGRRLPSGPGADLISSAVVAGAIQVPPSGEPILLMADRQTTGGYPIVGVVATADLPSAAQLRPGDRVCFATSSLEQAQRALCEQEDVLKTFRGGT